MSDMSGNTCTGGVIVGNGLGLFGMGMSAGALC